MRLRFVGVIAAVILAAGVNHAYIEVPHSLGQCVQQSTQICLMEVTKLDKDKGLIIFKKLKDVKGVYPEAELKHNIAKRGFHPREWQTIMAWAEVGKKAVFFSNGGASETCIGTYWYQCYREGPWWGMSHAEPFLLRTYCGDAEKLVDAVTAMLQGKEVVVPCMVDGDKQLLHERKAKMQLMKASLKLQDYNAKRDFVGWGGDPVDIPQYRTVLLLPESSENWKYIAAARVNTNDNTWYSTTYKDDAWRKGKAPIGYGEPEIEKRKGTVVTDKGQAFIFRKEFDVPGDLLKQKDLTIRLQVASDDSAIVYINGRMADQENTDHEFAYWNREVDINKELLVPGRNVIAVIVKNGGTSSDLFMDLQITGMVLLPKKPVAVVANQVKLPPVTTLADFKEAIPASVKVDAGKKEVAIPCTIAPRKLPNLKEIYPIEVFASYPAPKGQKAHETVVVFDNIKPSAVHQALMKLGANAGKPARGEGVATGPELQIFLEVTSNGQTRRIPIEQTMVDIKSNKPLPPLKWHFTGSNLRQPNPEKDDYVYGANLTGTLISLYPVTDDCVIQSSLSMKEEGQMRLEVNRSLLPPEGTTVQLVIRLK